MGEPFPPRRRWAVRPDPVSGPRLLARLHVLHSRCPPGSNRQAAGDGPGSGRWHARSGLWLDKGNRIAKTRPTSWDVTTTTRNRRCFRWALTKPMTGSFTHSLLRARPISIMVRDLMIETGVLNKELNSVNTPIAVLRQSFISNRLEYEPALLQQNEPSECATLTGAT